MIIDDRKLEKRPEWSNRECNRWADYIELVCIKDKIATIDDILDIWCDGDIDNSIDSGGQKHAEKIDSLYNDMTDYFAILSSREKFCSDYYPFEVNGKDCIRLRDILTDKHKKYIYLLLSSSIVLMDRSTSNIYTTSFEKICRLIMKQLFPDEAVVELFGTTRGTGVFEGTLRARIEKLAECLGVTTTKRFDRNPNFDAIHGGDGGLDIFAYQPIDAAGPIPFSFAQCTCSYDKWIEKQNSVGEMRWKSYLEISINYPQYMFVPFSCHDSKDKFYNETAIYTILVDRIRIIRLIEKGRGDSFLEELLELTSCFEMDAIFA